MVNFCVLKKPEPQITLEDVFKSITDINNSTTLTGHLKFELDITGDEWKIKAYDSKGNVIFVLPPDKVLEIASDLNSKGNLINKTV